MLCRLKEGGKEKCYQYWPQAQDETMIYKPLIITTKLLDTRDPDFIYSRIELRCQLFLILDDFSPETFFVWGFSIKTCICMVK